MVHKCNFFVKAPFLLVVFCIMVLCVQHQVLTGAAKKRSPKH